MGAIASQITSLTVVYSIVYADADQRKLESSASLAIVREFTGTGEFPAQRASNAENVSIWWRHHESRMNYAFLYVDDITYQWGTMLLAPSHHMGQNIML